jgi:hypothetical protein
MITSQLLTALTSAAYCREHNGELAQSETFLAVGKRNRVARDQAGKTKRASRDIHQKT